MDFTTKLIARLAGVMLLLVGAGLIGMGALAVERQVALTRTLDSAGLIGTFALFGIGSWLAWMGIQLAADKPNKYGSTLPPAGWYTLSVALFFATTVAIVVSVWKSNSTPLSIVPFSVLMGWWCWSAANSARGRIGSEGPQHESLGPIPGSRKGYFRLMTVRGVPVFVHRSLPMGGIMFAVYAGFDAGNVLYYCLGYFLLVGLHEGAHALAARMLGLRVWSIDISGVGGLCHVELAKKVWHAVIVYSAGIIIQLILLAAAITYDSVVGKSTTQFEKSLVATFTIANAIVLVLNILPRKSTNGLGTDGQVLWQLFLHVFRKHPHPFSKFIALPSDQSPVFSPDTRLLTIVNLVPKDFKQGVEILNDSKTPMDFVVTCLRQHLGLSQDDSITTMIAIHNNGGVLIALPSWERAEEVAGAIATDARQQGHPLVCRSVDAAKES